MFGFTVQQDSAITAGDSIKSVSGNHHTQTWK